MVLVQARMTLVLLKINRHSVCSILQAGCPPFDILLFVHRPGGHLNRLDGLAGSYFLNRYLVFAPSSIEILNSKGWLWVGRNILLGDRTGDASDKALSVLCILGIKMDEIGSSIELVVFQKDTRSIGSICLALGCVPLDVILTIGVGPNG